MKSLLKEPLIHFLLIGLLIFLVYDLVGDSETDDNTIVFNSYDLNNILSKWEKQWKRPPTEQELKNIIEQDMKQELFYREALKMNLDHNDEIIKRRLSQKMQFLSNDLVALQSPTEDDLKDFYQKHLDNYLTNYIFSLHHVTYSYDNHEQPSELAESLISSINVVELETLKGKGDVMPFPNHFSKSDEIQIRKSLGKSFTDAIKESALNIWTGPIQSGFGFHLVYILERQKPQPIAYEKIKDRVINDFNYQRQQNLDASLFNEIKKQYNFNLDLNEEEFAPEIIKVVESTLNPN